ncbi:MAG: acyltransferase [Desulfobacteraceae bacterium]|jgi:acetyltransferase-like isoleucine patch superfamily enzyme
MSILDRIYVKFFVPSGFAYAAYLKRCALLHHQGDNCFISKSANLPDPYLTSIGNNVWITSGCQLLCHDASVVMINFIFDQRYDRVGPIILNDNVFLGNNVIILPNITIGSNVIVGAGAVVTKNVPDNTIWAGNPARMLCTFQDYVHKIEAQTANYPWASLLTQKKTPGFDPILEQRLKIERSTFFFGQSGSKSNKDD